MIDFQAVRMVARILSPDEFDAMWDALGVATRIAAVARRRHNIAALALRNSTGGIKIAGFRGPHSRVTDSEDVTPCEAHNNARAALTEGSGE